MSFPLPWCLPYECCSNRSGDVEMSLPEISSREEWLAARMALLAREKELTRARDALNADRRRLPMVRIEKAYAFEGPGGQAGCSISSKAGGSSSCSTSCSTPRGTTAARVARPRRTSLPRGRSSTCTPATRPSRRSRAPAREDRGLPRRKGWNFPWYRRSGATSTTTSTRRSTSRSRPWRSTTARASRSRPPPASRRSGCSPPSSRSSAGLQLLPPRRRPHLPHYSTFARGTEAIGGAYAFLDLTALGRQEDWEEPKGREENAAARCRTSRPDDQGARAPTSAWTTAGSRSQRPCENQRRIVRMLGTVAESDAWRSPRILTNTGLPRAKSRSASRRSRGHAYDPGRRRVMRAPVDLMAWR